MLDISIKHLPMNRPSTHPPKCMLSKGYVNDAALFSEYLDYPENEKRRHANSRSTLPHELLAIIFAFVGWSFPPSFFNSTPMLLTRVSPVWRHIVQATGSLWTDIVIAEPMRGHIPCLDYYLKRSSNHLLSVTLIRPASDLHTTANIFERLAMEPTVRRIRTIHFDIEKPPLTQVLRFLQAAAKFNVLEEAFLGQALWYDERIFKALGEIRSLKRYHCNAVPKCNPILPSTNLTEVRFPRMFPAELFTELSSCTRLRRAHFLVDDVELAKYGSLRELRVQRNHLLNCTLEDVTVTSWTLRSSAELFAHLILPNLQHLVYNFDGDGDPGFDCLSVFFSNSQCMSLRSFTLNFCGQIDQKGIKKVLSTIPNRQNFRIRNNGHSVTLVLDTSSRISSSLGWRGVGRL